MLGVVLVLNLYIMVGRAYGPGWEKRRSIDVNVGR